jgi:septum formation protein
MNIILASKSPRRKQLLAQIGLKFDIVSSDVDENIVHYRNNPAEYCQELAKLKSEKVSKMNSNSLVIGADTIVVIDNIVLGKPKGKIDAFNMLQLLSGKTHHVFTGVSIQNMARDISISFFSETAVTFHKLNNSDIEYYINNFFPFDKAGSYGIQDWSSIFVKEISGCYYNVVGFPISKFYQEIKNLEIELNLVNN